MCSAGRVCVCECVRVLVGNSGRAGRGRGDPCDSHLVERLWIKGHMHLLCCRMMDKKQVLHVSYCPNAQFTGDAFAFLALMFKS